MSEFASANLTVGQINAIVKKLGGEEGALRFLRGELTVKEQDLLRKITTVSVSGATRFVAKDHLQKANIGWTGDNFKKSFLEKVEENIGDATITVHHLEKASLDASIMVELADCTEIQLVHFFELLKAQSKGEEGVLLVDGYVNIAYIRGIDGNFWAVCARWGSDCRGWGVEATSVEGPGGWLADRRVLSRDSL